MRTIANILLASMLFALCVHAKNRSIRFSGQLARGETFRKELNKDLIFALIPETSDRGAISGWTITVSPQGGNTRECKDFVWVVTPPYRGYNASYLDNSYGTTAEQAMKFSPRHFKFVLNCSDYQKEADRVDRILWSYNYAEAEVQEAQEQLGTSAHGSGRLWIRKYKISRSPRLAGGKDLGQIDSISFEVQIELPEP